MIPLDELPQLHSDSVLEQAKSTESLRACLVALGDETFAIDIRQVREVFELKSITIVPGMPAALVGVTNLRGTIVPLLDLRSALGLSTSVMPKYAVVIRHGTQQVGILVQEVPEIRTIRLDDLVVPSTGTAAERRPMISAFFKTENKLSAVLELSRLVASIEGTADDQGPYHHREER
jgi:purine-binding chemotaxis protein CheW